MTCWSLELLSLFNNLPTYKGAKVQVLKTTLSLEFYFASIMQKNSTKQTSVQQFSFEWSHPRGS